MSSLSPEGAYVLSGAQEHKLGWGRMRGKEGKRLLLPQMSCRESVCWEQEARAIYRCH